MKWDVTVRSMWNRWRAIKRRCLDESDPQYDDYGGRGIRICEEWALSFESFVDSVGLPPSLLHTIDRIDNQGHYEPGNVRWATRKDNARNRRSNRMVTIDGVTLCFADWCEIFEIDPSYARYRVRVHGMSDEDAISRPTGKQLEIDGRSQTLAEWARQYGINRDTVVDRIRRGWEPSRALKTPAGPATGRHKRKAHE